MGKIALYCAGQIARSTEMGSDPLWRSWTITTHSEKHFYCWADPFPRSLNDLEHGSSSPNDQQRWVAGTLDRDNLLDIIRTFACRSPKSYRLSNAGSPPSAAMFTLMARSTA
jgi:hypothetical protein